MAACNAGDKKGTIVDDDGDNNVGAAPTTRRLEAFPDFAMASLLLKSFLDDMPVSGHTFSINEHVNGLKGDVARLCGVEAEDMDIDESLMAKFLCEDVGRLLTKFEIKNEDGSLYLSAKEDNEDAAELLDKLRNLKTELKRLEMLMKKENFGESAPVSGE